MLLVEGNVKFQTAYTVASRHVHPIPLYLLDAVIDLIGSKICICIYICPLEAKCNVPDTASDISYCTALFLQRHIHGYSEYC